MQLPQVGRVLPGPAGKLQELAAAGALQQATPETLGLKPGSSTGGLSASQAGSQFDAAFLTSSWAAAKAHAEEDAVVADSVRSVKAAKELAVGKLPRMLLLLSSFHPSGAGSAFAKVKDQTGTMGAALHSSALQQQPQLGSGCVLLLQNVSVLTPNPGSCYLAVTADNISKVWGSDSSGRSILNTAHQPAGASTQHPQHQHTGGQQQRPPHQPPPASQQQRHQQPPSKQQYQPAFPSGYAGQQQRPATPAASGADSRQTGSLFPPPSPDINSVLNAMSGSHPGRAASAAGAGVQAGAGPRSQQQPQRWQQQRAQQQGEFSPAVSGIALGAAATCSHQQQQPGPGSMAPPPPRVPAGRTTQHSQQQSQQQQQQQRAGGIVRGQSQEEQVHGPSLFRGLSQPDRPAAGAAAGGGSQRPGAWQSNSSTQGPSLSAPGGSSGPGSRGWQVITGGRAGTTAAAAAAPMAAAEEEEDVEVDENIVAAIFGSQVPKAATAQPPQQQPPGSNITGAFWSSSQHAPPAAVGPGSSQQQQPWLQDGGNHSKQAGLTAGHVLCAGVQGSSGTGMPALGRMQPPPPRPQQQQQQQKWGMQGSSQQQQQKAGVQDRPSLSGGVLGRGPVGFGGTLLGKRPAAQLSLLDDLVADDLDDL